MLGAFDFFGRQVALPSGGDRSFPAAHWPVDPERWERPSHLLTGITGQRYYPPLVMGYRANS
jgi:hypothetical protein